MPEKVNVYRVFVYGTLKKGHGNHHYLEKSKFLGPCTIKGIYEFVDLGYFPAVVRRERGPVRNIVGEVYEVDSDTMVSLDALEGHPGFYERIMVATPFSTAEDTAGRAWVYTLPERTVHRPNWSYVDRCWRPSDAEREWMQTIPTYEPTNLAAVSGNA